MTRIEEAVGRSAPFVRVQPPAIISLRSPGTTDTNYPLGQSWINTSINSIFVHLGGGNWSEGGNVQATTTTLGIVELATSAEAVEGKDTERAMTPENVADVFAQPPTLGGLTPAEGNFTAIGLTTPGTGVFTQLTCPLYTAATDINLAITSVGTGQIILTSTDNFSIDSVGPITIDSSAAPINLGTSIDSFAVNIGTAGERAVTVGSNATASSITLTCGTGAANLATNPTVHTTTVGSTTGASPTILQAGTGTLQLSALGDVSMVPATNSVAGTSLTLNARVGVATFTGETTASGANVDLTITNSSLGAGDGIFCTVSNLGSNDADITLEGCITETAGTLLLRCQNNGAAALNGDIVATFWIIN